jgi:hypothetical protein
MRSRLALADAFCLAIVSLYRAELRDGENYRETEMERLELYKDFRIRAYEDWSGLWLAEAKRPFDTDAEYIATPFGHGTPEAAIADDR